MDLNIVVLNDFNIVVSVNRDFDKVPAEVALVAAGLGYYKTASKWTGDGRTFVSYYR